MTESAPAKFIYVFWDRNARSPRELAEAALGPLAEKLLALSPTKLTVLIHDAEAATVRCPAPPKPFESRPVGQISFWTAAARLLPEVALALAVNGFDTHGYRVEETVYTDYGGNRHGLPRNWPDGARSPGVMLLTLLQRPKHLDKAEWLRRWYGRQSPLSEAMQPRARYVRNLVVSAVTSDALPIEGIVEEAWPSRAHVENPLLFYGAANRWQLLKNQTAMLRSVTSFLDIWNLRTAMVGEYFLKT